MCCSDQMASLKESLLFMLKTDCWCFFSYLGHYELHASHSLVAVAPRCQAYKHDLLLPVVVCIVACRCT